MPGLIDKLGDNKVAVRQANGKLLAVLMDVLHPAVVLDALSPAFMHGNWKVREAAVNIFIQVLSPLTAFVKLVCYFCRQSTLVPGHSYDHVQARPGNATSAALPQQLHAANASQKPDTL